MDSGSSSSGTTTHSTEEPKLVEITITVIEAKIMKGPRNEPFISFVTVEMGENVLAVSDHCDLREDNTFAYDLTFKLQANVGDYLKIDDLVCKPLILTVTESAGISKKVKDTIPLCVCSVDILPILLRSEAVQAHRYVMQFFETLKKEPPIEPEIMLNINFTSGFLGYDLLKSCNIIRATLESCYSPPEEMIIGLKPDDAFCVGFTLPLLQETDEPVVYRNGIVSPGLGPRAANVIELRKWYTLSPTATGKALFIADSHIKSGDFESDVGDFQDNTDQEFRLVTENSAMPRIVWNTEFRSLITPAANNKLIQKIRQYKFMSLEFVRVTSNVKKKETSFNATAYVNLTPILFPGTREMHGAYQLHPLSETDLKAKTNKGSLFIRGTPSRQGSNFLLSILQKKVLGRENGTDKIEKPPEKGKQKEQPQDTEQDNIEPLEGIYSEQAVLFEEKRTYLTFRISLLHPLVQQREPDEIKLKVAELIPNRNLIVQKADSAQKALEEFGTQVCHTAALLIEDYKTLLMKDAAGSQTKDRLTTQDYRKTKFMHELKKTGKYFTCKEQLKYHIVKIVRDKFLQRSNFPTSQEYEEFLSTLYVFLIEEMHKNLNRYFGMNDPTTIPESISTSDDMKSFATDAFAIGRYDLAEKYHQVRIQRFGMEPNCWVDYGIYCLGVGNNEKAAECFRHALSLDNNYFRGLLLYGMVADVCGRSDQTETFLLHAVNARANSAVAHTIVGLYYHGIGNSIGADTYYKQAMDLIKAEPVPQSGDQSGLSLLADEVSRLDVSSIFLSSLPFLFNCNVLLYAQRALAQDLLSYQCAPLGCYFRFLATLRYMEGDYNAAESAIKDALERDNMHSDIWSLAGHIYLAQGNKNKAKQSFIRSLAIQKPPLDLHIVYYKLGVLALETKDYDKAKKHFMLTCKTSPSCLSWIGVGRACYFLEDWIDAEEAFAEANILDNTNAEVWGHLTLVALRTGRQDEVEQAYRFCVKCELKDKKLLDEIRITADDVGIALTPV